MFTLSVIIPYVNVSGINISCCNSFPGFVASNVNSACFTLSRLSAFCSFVLVSVLGVSAFMLAPYLFVLGNGELKVTGVFTSVVSCGLLVLGA